MDKHGLLKSCFDDSIYSFTFRFKDPTMEDGYLKAKEKLQFLTSSSKRFLLSVVFGFFIVVAVDIITAVSSNSEYNFTIGIWVVYSLLIPATIFEAAGYFCPAFSQLRGIAVTLIGTVVLFHNSFNTYKDKIYYPYVGTEYAFFFFPILYFSQVEYTHV